MSVYYLNGPSDSQNSGESSGFVAYPAPPCSTICFYADQDGELIYVDDGALELFQCQTVDELIELTGGTFKGMLASDDTAKALLAYGGGSASEQEQLASCSFRIATRSGTSVAVEAFGRRSEVSGRPVYSVALLYSPENATRYSDHELDPLTGLLNGDAFRALVDKRLVRDVDCSKSIIYFNIPEFKLYNTSLGQTQGDRLLRLFAASLENHFDGDLVCRLADDHFAVYTYRKEVGPLIVDVQADLEPYGEPQPRINAGIRSIAPGEYLTVRDACSQARIACDALKSRPDRIYISYNDEISRDYERRTYISAHIEKAIEDGDIQVYYQPVIRTLTGKVSSMEALARWHDGKYGSISPTDFVPALEESKKIQLLDRAVLNLVCRDIRDMLDRGMAVVPVSFNISRIDFDVANPFSDVQEVVSQYGIPREYLHLETTESVLAENEERVGEQLRMFQEAGYEVWMDDFGKGFSSLDLLIDHRFDAVKFDASLLRNMNDRSRSILGCNVTMAQSLHSRTIVEGAESREQVDFLRDIGCGSIQGFYFSEPKPLPETLAICDEKGLEFETPKEADVFNALDLMSVNLNSYYFLIQQEGDSILPIFLSFKLSRALDARGTYDPEKAGTVMRLLSFNDEQALKDLTSRAVQSNVPVAFTSHMDDRRVHATIEQVVGNDECRLFKVVLQNGIAFEDKLVSVNAEQVLDSLLLAVDGCLLLNYSDDTVTFLETVYHVAYSRQTVDGMRSFVRDIGERLVHPDDREHFYALLDESSLFEKDMVRGGRRLSRPFRLHRPNGKKYTSYMFTIIVMPESAHGQALLCMQQLSSLNPEYRRNADREFFNRFLNNVVVRALSETDYNNGLHLFIEGIGDSLAADRCYVVEPNQDGTYTETYEWCAEGAASMMKKFEGAYPSSLPEYLAQHDQDTPIIVSRKDIDSEDGALARYYMERRGAHSLVSVPLVLGDTRLGYIGADNPSRSMFEVVRSSLDMMGKFAAIMLRNRDTLARLDYLSLRDDLTGILNRRGLENYMAKIPDGTRLELVYGDINNLKRVNDQLGHDAGDDLIKRAGRTMLQVAGRGHVFRIGGDEFVMTFELGVHDDGDEPLRKLREAFKVADIGVAFGVSEMIMPVSNINRMIAEADRHMYENKAAMHAEGSRAGYLMNEERAGKAK
jgi:diguanylate cyclase (GGDEF)-like protein